MKAPAEGMGSPLLAASEGAEDQSVTGEGGARATATATSRTAAAPRNKAPREYSKSGTFALKRAINGALSRGLKVFDRRTPGARQLEKWIADVIEDLGGKERVSTQARTLVELTSRDWLLLCHVDAWLFAHSAVNAKKRQLFSIVQHRDQIADRITRNLALLGLERRGQKKPWKVVGA